MRIDPVNVSLSDESETRTQNNSWPLAIFPTNFTVWPINFHFGCCTFAMERLNTR